MDEDNNLSWREYRMLVISELERANNGVEECKKLMNGIVKRVEAVEREQAISKAKAGFYGAVAGLMLGGVPAIVSMFIR